MNFWGLIGRVFAHFLFMHTTTVQLIRGSPWLFFCETSYLLLYAVHSAGKILFRLTISLRAGSAAIVGAVDSSVTINQSSSIYQTARQRQS